MFWKKNEQIKQRKKEKIKEDNQPPSPIQEPKLNQDLPISALDRKQAKKDTEVK